jgi:prepilin-type N-terminal cleavage/methylation domain-containing protein
LKRINSEEGFTLVEIMVTVAIIALVLAIAIPSFVKAKESVFKNSCISNLKVVDEAVSLWSFTEGKGDDDPVTMADLLNGYLKTEPYCPLDTERVGYIVTTVSEVPVCPREEDYPDHILIAEEDPA